MASTSSIDKLQDEIKECVSAFANNEVGLIIVGIFKTGEVTGINHLTPGQLERITSVNQLLRNQSTKVKFVDCTNYQGKADRILLIYVPTSDGICETLKSPPEAWIRNGDRCEPLTDDVREMLKREKRVVEFERMPCCPFDAEDIDKDALAQFRQSNTGWNTTWSDEDFLYQIGALGKDKTGLYFTNAGYLFFSSRPQRMLPWAHVCLMRFDGKVNEYQTRGLPLPVLNNGDMMEGVYDLELEREWFKKASPHLKFLTGTLGMVLPVASSAVKLAVEETAYKLIEEQLDFRKSIIDATLGEPPKSATSSAQQIPPILNTVSPSAAKVRHCANSTPCSKPKTLASAVPSVRRTSARSFCGSTRSLQENIKRFGLQCRYSRRAHKNGTEIRNVSLYFGQVKAVSGQLMKITVYVRLFLVPQFRESQTIAFILNERRIAIARTCIVHDSCAFIK